MNNDKNYENVKKYWDIFSSSVSESYKDHWVDSQGRALGKDLYTEVAEYVLKNTPPGATDILEIGCGTGAILHEIAVVNPSVELAGIDFSAEQIKFATQKRDARISFSTDDIFSFAKKNQKKFDVIFLHSVTQYFPSEEYFMQFLNEAHSLLKKQGSLLMIDVPIIWYLDQMRSQPAKTLKSSLKNVIKKLIGYKPKVRVQTSAIERYDGKEIVLPTFQGLWVDPDRAALFAQGKFESFQASLQNFKNKPVDYRKYRPNFQFLGKI